jgi:uncharacterized membrane protein YgcG
MNELWTKPTRFNIDSGDELLTFTRAVPLTSVLLVSLTSAGCSDSEHGLVCMFLPLVLLALLAVAVNKPPRSGKRNPPSSGGAVVAGGEGYVGSDGFDVGGGDCGGDGGGGGDGGC